MTAKQNYTLIIAVALGMLVGCSKHPAASVVEQTQGGQPQASADAGKPSALAPGSPNAPGNGSVAPNAAVATPPAPPEETVIPAGHALRIRTTTALSTKTAKPGQRFEAYLSEPVVVNGRTVFAKGARVEGLVAESNPGGRIKGRAVIGVRLTAVESRGQMIPLQTNIYRRVARGTKSHDAMKIGGGAGAGAAIGAIAAGGTGAALGAIAGAGAGTGLVLATHGAPAEIGSESLLAFQLRAPLTVAQ